MYPDDTPPKVSPYRRIRDGSAYNMARLECTTHALTHIDAPYHFFNDRGTLDDIPPDRFICKAIVIEIASKAVLPSHIPTAAKLSGLAVLFKTQNSTKGVHRINGADQGYVSLAAARLLARKNVNLVGIDSLSVDRHDDETYPAHRTLLGNNVLILEDTDFQQVPPGSYTLVALPLRIKHGDGSPVRAILMPEEVGP